MFDWNQFAPTLTPLAAAAFVYFVRTSGDKNVQEASKELICKLDMLRESIGVLTSAMGVQQTHTAGHEARIEKLDTRVTRLEDSRHGKQILE